MTEKNAASVERLLPTPSEWDIGFWEAARQHRLVVQYCTNCKTVRSLPRLMCPVCRSFSFDWLQASGKGRLYSWSTLYRAFHPAYADIPRTIAIVELEDHPCAHLVSTLHMPEGVTEEQLRIGQAVEVFFTDLTDEISLPEFRLTET